VPTSPTQHPEPGVLEAFALGRLGTVEMDRVAAHLAGCGSCGRIALAAPEDPLIALLRRSSGDEGHGGPQDGSDDWPGTLIP
jgi:hypothetical protein